MVHRSVVLFCKGNCKTDPKVATFVFPKDKKSKIKWIVVSHRKD